MFNPIVEHNTKYALEEGVIDNTNDGKEGPQDKRRLQCSLFEFPDYNLTSLLQQVGVDSHQSNKHP